MTGGGQADWFINLSITRDRTRGLLKLDQRRYAEQVLHTFGMSKCKSARTPAPEGQVLSKDMCPVTDIEKMSAATVPYQSILGKLLYFRITRPDILQIVSKLAAFSSCWGLPHWKAAKYVLRYIKGTINHGLVFSVQAQRQNDNRQMDSTNVCRQRLRNRRRYPQIQSRLSNLSEWQPDIIPQLFAARQGRLSNRYL